MRYLILIGTLLCLPGFVNAQKAKKRKLVFADEFNYTGLPDSTKWTYEEGFMRPREAQYYTVKRLENARVENGMLVIEARKETYPNAAYKAVPGKPKEKQQFASYTSASINTKGINSWKYGRIEARAKVNGGKGTWPAVWMLGNDHGKVKWPECGEIDIIEFLGRDPTRVYGTIHYADTAGKHAQEGTNPVVGSPADDFHIYAVEWDDKQITCYYDNLKYLVFEYDKVKVNPRETFKKNYFLLINLAIQGNKDSWDGPLDENIFPTKFYVDYVRIYQ